MSRATVQPQGTPQPPRLAFCRRAGSGTIANRNRQEDGKTARRYISSPKDTLNTLYRYIPAGHTAIKAIDGLRLALSRHLTKDANDGPRTWCSQSALMMKNSSIHTAPNGNTPPRAIAKAGWVYHICSGTCLAKYNIQQFSRASHKTALGERHERNTGELPIVAIKRDPYS